jgi:hypothetical protein
MNRHERRKAEAIARTPSKEDARPLSGVSGKPPRAIKIISSRGRLTVK